MENSKDIVFTTHDGSKSLVSARFGEAYHSRHGALQESLHVFIGHGLEYKSLNSNKISVLEMGFGTGLNAALTWEFALNHPEKRIHYTGIEAYPVPDHVLEALDYSSLLNLDEFHRLHTTKWNENIHPEGNFSFQKVLGKFEEIDYKNEFDVIYYDAFAPGCQPELWDELMMKRMHSALHHQGVLVTYCAKGSFKRALKSVGFTLEKLPGPTGKREMTRATKSI